MAVSGRRYYSPSQGRFLGRDPKGEVGGIHLHAFTSNNPVNRWDYLGMTEQMAAYVVNGGRRETRHVIDSEDGCEYEEEWQDMSPDPAYGVEQMELVKRTKIYCPKKSEPSDQVDDNPAKTLPPCSQFKKGVTATYQSFIGKATVPDPLGRGNYLGDDRRFSDSPSGTYRTSYTVGFSESGGPFSNLDVTPSILIRSDGSRSVYDSNQSVVPDLTLVSGAYVNSSGNIAIRHYPIAVGVAGVPFSSYVAPIVQATNLLINVSTGVMSGTITHSGSPSFQIFLNGNKVWQSAEPKKREDFLKAIRGGPRNETINQPVCDPSR